LIPKPPPMSCEYQDIWSAPARSVGESIIVPKIGIWLLERISIMSVPGSQLMTAPKVSSGVEEKRWK
jgi:hypothetical protein